MVRENNKTGNNAHPSPSSTTAPETAACGSYCTTLESTDAGNILEDLYRLWNSVQSENSPGAGAACLQRVGSRVENKGCDPNSGDSGSDLWTGSFDPRGVSRKPGTPHPYLCLAAGSSPWHKLLPLMQAPPHVAKITSREFTRVVFFFFWPSFFYFAPFNNRTLQKNEKGKFAHVFKNSSLMSWRN